MGWEDLFKIIGKHKKLCQLHKIKYLHMYIKSTMFNQNMSHQL